MGRIPLQTAKAVFDQDREDFLFIYLFIFGGGGRLGVFNIMKGFCFATIF